MQRVPPGPEVALVFKPRPLPMSARHAAQGMLPGVGAKSVIVPFAKGDPVVRNPTKRTLVRTGDLRIVSPISAMT
jgi:hypothetical protein